MKLKLRGRVVLILAVVAAAIAFGGVRYASGQSRVAAASPTSSIPVRAARKTRFEFRIFPVKPSTISCRIPHGGPSSNATLAGRCSTSLADTPGHGGAWIVTFTERWGDRWRFHHTWQVRVTATSKLVWIHQSGAQAPQTWR
jgi:hypothetical protein